MPKGRPRKINEETEEINNQPISVPFIDEQLKELETLYKMLKVRGITRISKLENMISQMRIAK
ncbi:MAG: hypothetical protein IH819_09905 [Bacteroidetes bacterium]|nr:hypothetical protein [Bacteroidota bacterium]